MTPTVTTTTTTTTTTNNNNNNNSNTVNINMDGGNLTATATAIATSNKPLVPATVFCLEVALFVQSLEKKLFDGGLLAPKANGTAVKPTTMSEMVSALMATKRDIMEQAHTLQGKANDLAEAHGASCGAATKLLTTLLTAAATAEGTTTTTSASVRELIVVAQVPPPALGQGDDSICANETMTMATRIADDREKHAEAMNAMKMRQEELLQELTQSRGSEQRLLAQVVALESKAPAAATKAHNTDDDDEALAMDAQKVLVAASPATSTPSPTQTDSDSDTHGEAAPVVAERVTFDMEAFNFTLDFGGSPHVRALEAKLAALRLQQRQQLANMAALVETVGVPQRSAASESSAAVAAAAVDHHPDTQSEPGRVLRSRIPPPRIVVPRRVRLALQQQQPEQPIPAPALEAPRQPQAPPSPPQASPTGMQRAGRRVRTRVGAAMTATASPTGRSPRVRPTAAPAAVASPPAAAAAVAPRATTGRALPRTVRTQPARAPPARPPQAVRRVSLDTAQPRQQPPVRWR